MNDILIDNSYLLSAYRCVEGKAKSNYDLQNYYRFLGEILSHNNIYINVNPKGVVFPYTNECINYLYKVSNNRFQIKLLDQAKIDYSNIITRIASKFSEKNFADLFSVKFIIDIQPDFTETNPDEMFHKWLINNGSDQILSKIDLDKGATYISIFLAKELGLEQYFRITRKKTNWSVRQSLTLAAKLRTMIYMEIAKEYNLSYIPSAGRGQNSQYHFCDPSLRELFFKDETRFSDFKDNFSNNISVINSLILRNQYYPDQIIKDTLEIRNSTNSLRNTLYKRPLFKRGDSLLRYQYEKIGEYKKILDDYFEKDDKGNLVSKLNPSFTFSEYENQFNVTLPFGEFFSEIINQHHRSRITTKLNPFILSILSTRSIKKENLLNNLKRMSSRNG